MVTYTAAIAACGNGNQWCQALAVLAQSVQATLETTAVACSAAISACEQCQRWQHALHLVATWLKRGEADEVMCNAAISACAQCSQWAAAVSLLSLLDTATPSCVGTKTLNAAMRACAKAAQWRQALVLLDRDVRDVIMLHMAVTACAAGRQIGQLLVRIRDLDTWGPTSLRLASKKRNQCHAMQGGAGQYMQ